MAKQETGVADPSWSHVSWLTIALALLTVVTFFAVNETGGRYIISMMESGGGVAYTSGTMAVTPTSIDMVARENGASYAPSPSNG